MAISTNDIKLLQEQFDLTYHVPYARTCDELVGFENKDILVVGGSLPENFVIDCLGVKSWTALETPEYEDALKSVGGITHRGTQLSNEKTMVSSFQSKESNPFIATRYRFYLGNIEKLPEVFYDSFDLVFSIACFEHIQHFPEALEKMYRALRPGGKLFAMFSPIWSAFNGHHLPKMIDERGNTFNHNNSPIPPWGHLTMRPAEMYSYLLKQTDSDTAAKIVYYVYQSPFINRFFTEDYSSYFKLSRFHIERFDLTFPLNMQEENQATLEKLYPRNRHFANNGILLIASRT